MNTENLRTHDDLFNALSKDPEFRREHRRQEPYYILANEVFACRKDLGLTQAEIAERAGTHQSRISKLEAGSLDVRLSTLIQIAEALAARVEIHLVPILDITNEQYQEIITQHYSTAQQTTSKVVVQSQSVDMIPATPV
jgi:transcriptional regulator with XRE-family HTH domain